MPNHDASRDYDLLDRLVDEFNERFRRGERPTVQEYCARYPELAEDLRDLLPALAQVEQAKDELGGTVAGGPPPTPSAIHSLGDFRILREVGRGGMGVVYEAEQLSLGRRVALKVLTDRLIRDTKQKRRFEREAKAAAKLHHTNIVPVFGTGEADGIPYYVMQFIQGMGLDAVIDELARMTPRSTAPTGHNSVLSKGEQALDAPTLTATGRDVPPEASVFARSLVTGEFQPSDPAADPADPAPNAPTVTGPGAPAVAPASRADPSGPISAISLPGHSSSTSGAKRLSYWQSTARIAAQVADALDYAHKQGIVHRDIKPSNLLLDMAGTVWVTDFGLAKADTAENLTHTGDVLGTLRYMPPEAFDGKADARGDVYALGLTLYELLALRPAFDERDRNRLVKQVTTGEPEALGRVRKGVPRDLQTIVAKATDRDPARRYQTAGELRDDLSRFLDDEPIKARRQSHWERARRWARHHPTVASLIGLIALLMTAVTIASVAAAAHFDRLARVQTRTALAERLAREEAEQAKDREAKQREKAEAATASAEAAHRESEASKGRALDALKKAEEAHARARAAVNDYLTAVSDDPRLKVPGLTPLRVQLLQSALGFYNEFLRERGTDPALRKEVAGVYLKVGDVLRDLGQSQPATQNYRQSRLLYEALSVSAPNDLDVQDGLARALARNGQDDRAIEIWEKIIRPDDPRHHADLGTAYTSRALRAERSGDLIRALEALESALTVHERLVKLRPEDPEALQGLSASLNNIAVRLTNRGRLADALALYHRAVEHNERAYRLRPTDLTGGRFLLIQLGNVASTAATLGETDEALAAHRRRVEVLDRRARDNPEIPGMATQLVQGSSSLVRVLHSAGRLDEATRAIRQTSARVAEVSEDHPAFPFALAEFHVLARDVYARRAEHPDAARAAVTAVAALRSFFVASSRFGTTLPPTPGGNVGAANTFTTLLTDPGRLRTDARFAALRERTDFRDLIAHAEAYRRASVAIAPDAPAATKVAARREMLAALETLAGPAAPDRPTRLVLAHAQQELGKAYLEDGRLEEARPHLEGALAAQRRLVEEAPRNEQFRADLARGRIAIGSQYAATNQLADAVRAWDEGLTELSSALRASPASFTLRTALVEQLAAVGEQYGRLGLWPEAIRYYQQAFSGPPPVEMFPWSAFALLAIAQDPPRYQELVTALPLPQGMSPYDTWARAGLLVLAPEGAKARPDAVRQIAEGLTYPGFEAWAKAYRGLARLRLGEAERALPELQAIPSPLIRSPALALAAHLGGRADEAREYLRSADRAAEAALRGWGAAETPVIPESPGWRDWLRAELLRAEAHRAIHGKPPPEFPHARLHRGRVLAALGQAERAGVEFDAAVALRPDDPDVWLARALAFARLGKKDRAIADRDRAATLKSTDPQPWILLGRVLAELGEQELAADAHTRAAAISKELEPFLEPGWWIVGPYPPDLQTAFPPEFSTDPSTPVAGAPPGELRWKHLPADGYGGTTWFRETVGSAKNVSYYALAHVHADRDRTAVLQFRTATDGRVYINGRLVWEGTTAWNFGAATEMYLPVTLKAGPNTVLLKVLVRSSTSAWFACHFDDTPRVRANRLARLGLWAEAADAYAGAAHRIPLSEWDALDRAICLQVLGREEEYRKTFEDMVRRFTTDSATDDPQRRVIGCFLPPLRTEERDRWAAVMKRHLDGDPKTPWRYRNLAQAYYRAGRFNEAEVVIRDGIKLDNRLDYNALLAATLARVGKPADARRLLGEIETRYAKELEEAARSAPYYQPLARPPMTVYDQGALLIYLRETRTLLTGKDPGPHPTEAAVRNTARKALEADDPYVRFTAEGPQQAVVWSDLGRRLVELGKWEEAASAFNRAVELAPKNSPIVWVVSGRVHAQAGRWDEAAAACARALDLAPDRKNYWTFASGSFREVIGRDEVFARVVKLRPDDPLLWVLRARLTAEDGRWAEAAAAATKVTELRPDERSSWDAAAPILVRNGDIEGYHRCCAEVLRRFGDPPTQEALAEVVRTCLLAPGLKDLEPITQLMGRPWPSTKDPRFQLGLAMLEYRLGRYDDAILRLGPLAQPPTDANPGTVFPSATSQAFLAMAYHRTGRGAEARQSLDQARWLVEGWNPRPERGQTLGAHWHDWLRCRLAVTEAEALVPAAAVAGPVAVPAAPGAAEAARSERKLRADRLATEFALAELRFDAGLRAEAEALLRKILARRIELVAEEPGNFDYRTHEADTRLALGRALVADGRFDEGLAEVRRGLAFHAVMAPLNPQANPRRLRFTLASHMAEVGTSLLKAGRDADGAPMVREAVERLAALRREDPTNSRLANAITGANHDLGELYVRYGLWAEALEPLRAATVNATTSGDPWRWVMAARAHRLNDLSAVNLTVAAAARFKSAPPADMYPLAILAGFSAHSAELGLTREVWTKVVAGRPHDNSAVIWGAVHDYRTRRYEQAFDALRAERFASSARARAVQAMALFRLEQTEQARRLLAEARDLYAARARDLAFAGAAVGPLSDPGEDADDLSLLREAHRLITGAVLPPSPFAAVTRARGWFMLGDEKRAGAEMDAAVLLAPDDPLVWFARAGVWWAHGRPVPAAADLARARQLAARDAVTRPLDLAAAARLVATHARPLDPVWTVARPVNVKSDREAILTVAPDASVTATGPNPDRAVYTLEFELDGPVSALRLEALTDRALLRSGPGRSTSGNFHINEFQVEVWPANGVGPPVPVKWARSFASHEQQNGLVLRHATDGNPASAWGIGPREGRPHWAVFVPTSPLGKSGRVRITVTIDTGDTNWAQTTLGRFRIAAAGGTAP